MKELGHPEYITKKLTGPFKCSQDKSQVDMQIKNTEQQLSDWKEKILQLQSQYKWLLYFNMPKLLQLYSLLNCPDVEEKVGAILNEMNFLACRKIEDRLRLKTQVNVSKYRILKNVKKQTCMFFKLLGNTPERHHFGSQ